VRALASPADPDEESQPTDRFQRRVHIMPQQGVAKGQQTVDPVKRWSSVSSRKPEIFLLTNDQMIENAKINICRFTFKTTDPLKGQVSLQMHEGGGHHGPGHKNDNNFARKA
jgi:hypothetical protein